MKQLLLVPALLVVGRASAAQSASPPAGFSILNPTPMEAMRDLSTDRPDRTESPYTVPAGRFQFEFDVASLERHRDGELRSTSLELGAANLKLGLLHNVDLQFVVAPLAHERVSAAGLTSTRTGVGDISARVKLNLWGNDGGRTAFGAMPYVTYSPADDGSRSASVGVILPFAIDLADDWGIGAMLVAGREPGDAGAGNRSVIESSVTVSHDLTGRVGGYVEFWNRSASGPGVPWQATADAGVAVAVGPNLQLDGGLNFGLTRATPRWNPFLGFSVRF